MDFVEDIAALTEQQADLLDLLLEDLTAGVGMSLESKVTVLRKGEAPLIVVHGSGGRCFFLHALARHLPMGSGLWGIETTASAAHAEPADPRDAYLAALRAAQPSGPYRLAGYSAGCLIAFEIAVRLKERGEEVEILILIDPMAPPDDEGRRDGGLLPSERLRRRFDMAELAGITPLSPEYAFVAQANRNFATFVAGFRRRKLEAPIRIVHGMHGAFVSSPQTLEDWADLSVQRVECAAVDCDHFEIVREPHVANTGRLMRRWLGASSQGQA